MALISLEVYLVELRVVFFVWSVALGKIFTLNNLRTRHIRLVYMCKKSGKTVDQVLLHCETV